MDGDPLVQRPFGGGVELLLVVAVLGGERDGGERERGETDEGEQALRHALASWPKYSTSETASSTLNASA